MRPAEPQHSGIAMSIDKKLFEDKLLDLAQVEMDEWADRKGLEAAALDARFEAEDLDCPGLHRDYYSLGRVRTKARRDLWKSHWEEKGVFKQGLKDKVHGLVAKWGPFIERAAVKTKRFQ